MIVLLAGAGCAWVEISEAGQGVKILDPSEVEACEQIGRTRSTTQSKLLFVSRNKNKVLEEQTALARNEAAHMGGNAVVVAGEPEGSSQLFNVYKCPN